MGTFRRRTGGRGPRGAFFRKCDRGSGDPVAPFVKEGKVFWRRSVVLTECVAKNVSKPAEMMKGELFFCPSHHSWTVYDEFVPQNCVTKRHQILTDKWKQNIPNAMHMNE